jgi:hypothetical protein
VVATGDELDGVAYAPCTSEAGGIAVESSGSELRRATDGARDGGRGAADRWSFILGTVGRLVSDSGVAVMARKVESCRLYITQAATVA